MCSRRLDNTENRLYSDLDVPGQSSPQLESNTRRVYSNADVIKMVWSGM